MPNAQQLRAECARLIAASKVVDDVAIKKRLAQDALDLAQLAEQLERAEAAPRQGP